MSCPTNKRCWPNAFPPRPIPRSRRDAPEYSAPAAGMSELQTMTLSVSHRSFWRRAPNSGIFSLWKTPPECQSSLDALECYSCLSVVFSFSSAYSVPREFWRSSALLSWPHPWLDSSSKSKATAGLRAKPSRNPCLLRSIRTRSSFRVSRK